MNLRVDIILESEQRSASVINIKFIMRMVYIFVPSIIGLIAALAAINMIALGSKVKATNRQWQLTEPRKKKAETIKAQKEANFSTLDELNGWKTSQLQWHEVLRAIQRIVPAKIQIKSFQANHALMTIDSLRRNDKTPARKFDIVLNGIAVGASAEKDIHNLTRSLKQAPGLKDIVADAKVKQYTEDPKDRNNRIFRIECSFKPRAFAR